MPADDVYRAAVAVKVNDINTLNVMHFRQIGDEGSNVPAASLKEALELVLLPAWVPMLSEDTTIESVVIKKILTGTDQPYMYSLAAGAGTVAEEAEPANLGVVFSHYTDNNSKTGRGRNYLCGVAAGFITSTRPTAAFVTLFETFQSVLLSSMTDVAANMHWTMCHYSPTNDDSDPIAHIELRMQLRTIRGRNRN